MFDSNKMLNLGFAFLNAGEANFHEGAIKQRSVYQNVAGVVNLAFACELFMKCLLNMNETEMRVHRLADLWHKYKVICGDKASEIETAVMKRLDTGFTFEEMIQDDDNVFDDYRYFFEPEHLNEITNKTLRPQFLRVLAHVLYIYLDNELTR